MHLRRRFWIVAAVWVVFWSLYPTFARPRAFQRAVRIAADENLLCDRVANEDARRRCWSDVQRRMQERVDAVTLRSEYAGYAPVWFGVGVCPPLIAWMALKRRRRV